MKRRHALQTRLIQNAGVWAVKQVLTSLPFVGVFFKIAFFAMDIFEGTRPSRQARALRRAQVQPVVVAA